MTGLQESGDNMIEFQQVTKKYGNNTALDRLDLQIKTGEIFGFLGHNGAGKSTTIKSLVSVIEPTSGKIIVDGKELSANRLEIKKRIGYVPDTPDLFLQLSAGEYWYFNAAAYEEPTDKKKERLE